MELAGDSGPGLAAGDVAADVGRRPAGRAHDGACRVGCRVRQGDRRVRFLCTSFTAPARPCWHVPSGTSPATSCRTAGRSPPGGTPSTPSLSAAPAARGVYSLRVPRRPTPAARARYVAGSSPVRGDVAFQGAEPRFIATAYTRV